VCGRKKIFCGCNRRAAANELSLVNLQPLEHIMHKTLIGSALALVLLGASGAVSADEVPYQKAQLEQTLVAGKPAIVYVHATWCPTCKVQQPIVDKLSAEPQLKGVTIFVADFDKETELKKQLKVSQQSTFVVFKQGHEVTRSTGQTQEPAIRATFDQAL
jgi:thioredoxin 1